MITNDDCENNTKKNGESTVKKVTSVKEFYDEAFELRKKFSGCGCSRNSILDIVKELKNNNQKT